MPKRFILEKLLDRARGRTGEQGATQLAPPADTAALLSFAPSPPHRRRSDKPWGCEPMCTGLYRVVAITPERAHLNGCAICRHCGTVWCPR